MGGHVNGFSLDRQLVHHLKFHPTLVLPRIQDWLQGYFVFYYAILSTLKFFFQVLWLLSFDDKNTLADAVDKYCIGVPPIQWLAWIPQLLTCLVGSEGKPLLNLISQVCTYSADVAQSVFVLFVGRHGHKLTMIACHVQ